MFREVVQTLVRENGRLISIKLENFHDKRNISEKTR